MAKQKTTATAAPTEVTVNVSIDPQAVADALAAAQADTDAKAAADAEAAKQALPAQLTLARPHGFIDDTGAHRFWSTGQVVTDPAEIALLLERKAHVLES